MSRTRRPSHLSSILFSESLEPRRLLSGQTFYGEGPLIGAASNVGRTAAIDLNADGASDLVFNGPNTSYALSDGKGGFGAVTPFATGFSTTDVVTGDFNGDTVMDLAFADTSNNNAVTLRLGTGNGAYGAPTRYSLSTGVTCLTTGDFNGDGKLDVAAAGSQYYFQILLGNGNGTLGVAASYTVYNANNYTDIVAGDFTGDGKVDVAMTASQYGMRLIIGNGDGTFGNTISGISSTRFLATGDFNGDNKPDLISDYGNSTAVQLNTGGGTFSFATFASGVITSTGTLTDFNHDNRPDAVVVDSKGDIYIMRNNGTGTMTSAQILSPSSSNPKSITSGDFNADGRPDLAVSSTKSGGVSVHLNGGTSAFDWPQTITASTVPQAVVSGDFTNDGKLDAIALTTNGLIFLRGSGTGTFTNTTVGLTGTPNNAAAGDFDNDGLLDLIVDYAGTATAQFLHGNGNGGFSLVSSRTTGTTPRAIVTGDFNGDGNLDYVTANTTDATYAASLFLGTGTGGFAAALGVSAGTLSAGLAAADLNQDGRLDLVVANTTNNTLSIVRGNGNGTFQTRTVVNTTYRADAVVIADFNSDGLLDLAITSAGIADAFVSVFTASYTGGYNAAVRYNTGPNGGTDASRLLTGDFNGDGIVDLVTTHGYITGGGVSVLYGKNTGGFRGTITPLGNNGSVTPGDFDGDGKLDLLVSRIASGNFALLLNQRQSTGPVTGGNGTITVGAIAGGANVYQANGVLYIASSAGTESRLLTSVSGVAVAAGATVRVLSDLGAGGRSISLSTAAGSAVTFNTAQHLATLNVAGGSVAMTAGRKLLRVTGLTVGSSARLDLNDSDLLYDYAGASPLPAVRGLLATGRTPAGTWAGPGIASTAAAAAGTTTLGLMTAAEYQSIYGTAATFDGEAIDGTAVLLKYTLYGDTDFDRRVDFNDFLRLQTAYGTTSGATSAAGDFDYDGDTDFNDFLAMQSNYNTALPDTRPAAKTAVRVSGKGR